MGWQVTPFLDVNPCLEALKNALRGHTPPEIINSDQGCQFTSEPWVTFLTDNNIKISMDGKGR